MDTSYRQEFKDLFDASFRRLESEMAGLRERVDTRLQRMEARFETVDVRIAGLEGVMNARMLGLEGRIVELQGRLLAEMDAKLGKQKWSLLTWTILMWLGTLGFMAAMLRR